MSAPFSEVSKINFVLITTWFPPKIGVAVNRMIAFARYLDKEKYNITVLTIGEKFKIEIIENGIKVIRLENNSVLKTFETRSADSKILHYSKVLWNVVLRKVIKFQFLNWSNNVYAQLIQMHKLTPIDVVCSSFNPVESHLAAYKFCLLNKKVKWITSMRDEMSGNIYLNKKERNTLRDIEMKINSRADAVVSVSKDLLDGFLQNMPDVKFFEEINNGFDHDFTPLNNFNEEFTIAFAGTFYGDIKPVTFFKALQSIIKKQNFKFKLILIGSSRNVSIPDELYPSVFFRDKIPYSDLIPVLAEVDATLLILPKTNRKGVYSGKLYDYLSIMKPIIAVVDPDDVAAKLIKECNAGFVADFDNIPEIETAILNAYELWKHKKHLNYDKERIALLHRRFQVKKLEGLIEKLIL